MNHRPTFRLVSFFLATGLLALILPTSIPARALPPVGNFSPTIDAFQKYDGQAVCDPVAKPGVLDWRNLIMASYPDTADYGITRACDVGAQSEHKEGRAWDWHIGYASDPAAIAKANEFFDWLLATDAYGNQDALFRRLGLMYVIWNGRIFKSYQADKGWQTYSGSNPHTDHIHFSFSWAGANRLTTWWTQEPVITPYGTFPNGAYPAIGQVRLGGDAEIVAGPSAGGGPLVRVLQRDGSDVASFYAYDYRFTGGVVVGTADTNADGTAEVVTGPERGGSPHVRVIDVVGSQAQERVGFYAYDPAFQGGVHATGGNFDGDLNDELLVGPGPGGGPHVRVIKYANGVLSELVGFYAYSPQFGGGVNVAACNMDGVPGDEIVTAPISGGGPHVRVFKFANGNLSELAGFYAYDPTFTGGVSVACGDIDGDGVGELITGAGVGARPQIRVFGLSGGSVVEKASFYLLGGNTLYGLRVAAGNIQSGQPAKIAASFGPGITTTIYLRNSNGTPIG